MPIDKGKQEHLKITELKTKGYPYSKVSGLSISRYGAHRMEDAPRPGRPEGYPDIDVT